MSVYKRKNRNGELSATYYYDFKRGGERFAGDTELTIKSEAEAFEKRLIQVEEDRLKLVKSRGGGKVLLGHGSRIALEKETERSRKQERVDWKSTVHGDFVAYLKDKFPKVEYMHDVMTAHAESYIRTITDNGRWVKEINPGQGRSSYSAADKLSETTVRKFHNELRWWFKIMTVDAGITLNPFEKGIVFSKSPKPVHKEAFTPEQLATLRDIFTLDHPLAHIFYVGLSTGMRRGNICLLDWKDIDLGRGVIKAPNLKTGGKLTIPILPELRAYLEQTSYRQGFVNPELASRYQDDARRGHITDEFIRILENLGWKVRVKATGSRKVNVLGIHSLRHTFIYRAVIAGIPLNVVQCIAGHADEAMTKMYADHATAQDIQAVMGKFDVWGQGEQSPLDRMISAVQRLNPEQLAQLELILEEEGW